MSGAEKPTPRQEIAAVVGDSLLFSNVPGYRPTEFNFRCPNTGVPCTAMLRLISQYTRDVTPENLANGGAHDAMINAQKLSLKLLEYPARAKSVTCAAGDCAVRQLMNTDPARQAAVKAVRGFRDMFR